MNNERFQRRLAERRLALRRLAGLRQQQLLVKAGITRQQLQRREAGRNDRACETLFELARALGIAIGKPVDRAAPRGRG